MYKLRSLEITNLISFKHIKFEFRQGKAVILVGKNLDDSMQPRNGSGKSSLIECIKLAIDGAPIRDVLVKELINDQGAESGEVKLTFENAILNEELVLWRKLYSNTKSAEYRAEINGVDQKNFYSSGDTFNKWVWETLGITREDFLAFFLITSDKYKPFLKVGDTVKKEIVNRFSGADKVDLALPQIEVDSKKLGEDIFRIEKELLQNTTRQEMLAEQIAQEEEKISEEKVNQTIQTKELELEKMRREILSEEEMQFFHEAIRLAKNAVVEFDSNLETTLTPFREAVELAELEAEAFEFSQDYEVLLNEGKLQTSIANKSLLEQRDLLPKVKNQFKAEIDLINNDESELKQSIEDAEKELRDNEMFESAVNKQLLDSITCPSCGWHFSLKDKTFNYEEAKAKLPEVIQTIADYKEVIVELKNDLNVGIHGRKQEVNQKIIKAGEAIRNEIEAINRLMIEYGGKILALETKQREELNSKTVLEREVTKAKNSLKYKEDQEATSRQQLIIKVKQCEVTLQGKEAFRKEYQEQVKQMEEQILKLSLQEVDRSKINELTEQLKVLVKQEEDIKKRAEEKRKEKEGVDSWEINFKNFKSFLANKSIKNIQDYTNLFLENMGSNLSINIDGYKTLSNKKLKEQITTTVLRDGFESGSYGKFSGGERGRIDISVILAMQELILLNAPYGKGIDLLIADEILDQVDAVGLEGIINSLQSLGKTIIVVSQNEINGLVEHTITVQKKNKVSTILENHQIAA